MYSTYCNTSYNLQLSILRAVASPILDNYVSYAL